MEQNLNVLLLLDTQVELCRIVSDALAKQYTLHKATNQREAEHILNHNIIRVLVAYQGCKTSAARLEPVWQSLAREFSELSIIVFDDNAGDDDALKSLKSGADFYFNAPFNLDTLVNTTRFALVGEFDKNERFNAGYRNRVFQEIAKSVVSDSREKAFSTIIGKSVELLHAESGGIQLFHRNRNMLQESEVEAIMAVNRPAPNYDMKYGEGIAGKLIQRYLMDRSSPYYVIVDNYNKSEYKHPIYEVGGRHNPSVIKVLLLLDGNPVGVLYVDDKLPRKFNKADAELLFEIGQYASAAIAKFNLNEQSIRIETFISSVAHELQIGDRERILNTIVQGVKEVMGCDIVTLYTLDMTKKMLRNPPSHTELRFPSKVKREGYVTSGIMYELLEKDEIIVERLGELNKKDEYTKSYFRLKPFAVDEEIGVYAAVPIKSGNKKLGIMFVSYRYHSDHFFSDRDYKTLTFLANHAAIAITQQEVFDQERIRMRNLLHSSQSITSAASLEESLHEIVRQAANLVLSKTTSGSCICHLVEQQGSALVYKATYPTELMAVISRKFFIDLSSENKIGIIGRCIQTGKTQNVGDVTNDLDYIEIDPEIKSQISVPLKFQNRILGTISIESKDKNVFSSDKQYYLELLADQAAMAIEQTRILQLTRTISDGIIHEITLGERKKILQYIVDGIKAMLNCDVVTLYVRNFETHRWINPPTHTEVRYPKRLRRKARFYPKMDSLLERADPYVIKRIEEDPYFSNKAFGKDEEILSYAAIPLLANGEKVGLIYIMYRRPYGFTDREVENIRLLANQASIAIYNDQLFESQKKRSRTLEIIQEASNAILNNNYASLSLQDIAKKAIELIAGTSTVPFWQCHISTIIGTTLVHEASFPSPLSVELVKRINVDFARSTAKIGIAGRCVKDNASKNVGDAPNHPDYIKLSNRIQSQLSVPLRATNEVLGVITIERPEPGEFSIADQDILELLARQAAIAIEKSRLVNELQKSQAELRVMEWLNLKTMATEFTHRIANFMGTLLPDIDLLQRRIRRLDLPEQIGSGVLQLTGKIAKSAVYPMQLVDQLRQGLQNDNMEPKIVDMNDLVKKAIQSSIVPGNITMNMNFASELPTITANEQLVEVFIGMLENAIHAMPNGGLLTVTTRLTNGWVEACIADTGVGIDKEDQHRIFEMFYTTKSKESASLGLGLWISRKFVQRFGGGIDLVESRRDHGSVFVVRFPIN